MSIERDRVSALFVAEKVTDLGLNPLTPRCNKRKSSNTSMSVIEHVNGIDLFIDGHDHKEVSEEIGNTLLVETGCFLHNIGVVVIDQGTLAPELIAASTYDGIDESVQAIIDRESEQ